jgi:hypothetical protein
MHPHRFFFRFSNFQSASPIKSAECLFRRLHRFNTRVQNQGVANLIDPIACFQPAAAI